MASKAFTIAEMVAWLKGCWLPEEQEAVYSEQDYFEVKLTYFMRRA